MFMVDGKKDSFMILILLNGTTSLIEWPLVDDLWRSKVKLSRNGCEGVGDVIHHCGFGLLPSDLKWFLAKVVEHSSDAVFRVLIPRYASSSSALHSFNFIDVGLGM